MLVVFTLIIFLKLSVTHDFATLGFRTDNFGATLIPTSIFGALGIVVLFSMRFKEKKFKVFKWIISLITLYLAFGIVQQIFFQSIFTQTLSKVVDNKSLVVIFSSIFYSSFHWGWGPEGIRFGLLTLFAGVVWAILFLTSPNIYLLGFSHALLASIYYFMVRGDDILNVRLSLRKGRGISKLIYH